MRRRSGGNRREAAKRGFIVCCFLIGVMCMWHGCAEMATQGLPIIIFRDGGRETVIRQENEFQRWGREPQKIELKIPDGVRFEEEQINPQRKNSPRYEFDYRELERDG